MEFSNGHETVIIKREVGDEPDELIDVETNSDDLSIHIKVEKEDSSDEENEVIYENLPWGNDAIEDVARPAKTLIEYDKSVTIKTEIEIDEPMLQDFCPSTSHSKRKSHKPVSTKSKSQKTPTKKNSKSTSTKPKTKHQCKYCSKKFVDKKGLDSHSRLHFDELKFECNLCKRRFDKFAEMKKHKPNCRGRWYECYICQYSSLHWNWSRFMVHFRKHTGDKPYQCKCCAKQFSSKRMLNFHMKYHPNEILSKCSFCQRGFPTSAEAKDHESQCALKRQMECFLCKSTFTHKSSLQRHMPQHTGLFKFKCQYCQKAYARKDFLVLHLQTHTKELPFHCLKCKQRFPQQTDLDQHKLACKKKLFKCDLCNYSTSSETYAEDHKQQHIGTDEFKCWHCPEVFLQRSKLVLHVKTHKKTKVSFNCPVCQKSYKRWLIMEKHRQNCQNAPSTSKQI